MNQILIKAVKKAKKNGLLRLVPADVPVRLDCLADKCALCCRTLGAPVLTEAEAEKIPAEIVDRTRTGTFVRSRDCVCCLLKDNLCSLYADRPKGCAEYPWYNIDQKLYYDSGCPGIKFDEDQRPDVGGIQPFENFFGKTAPITLWLIRKMCIKKPAKIVEQS